MTHISIVAVRDYLLAFQDQICVKLEEEDGQAKFLKDDWSRKNDEGQAETGQTGPVLGGGGRTRVLSHGAVFEQAGVSFSHVSGASLPPSATAARPELEGRSFEALGVSLVIHPEKIAVSLSNSGELNGVFSH